MKTLASYEDLPANAAYIGSESGDGSMCESLADAIDSAAEPIRFRDEDGVHHYFELAI
jgi:hypothetical protein